MHLVKYLAVGTAALFTVAACGGSNNSSGSTNNGSSPASTTSASTGGSADASGGAADLATHLNLLLGEHLILASKATGAALGGRNDEFAAYGDLLNKNGTDLGDLIGAAYGDAAKTKFNEIWSAHNGFFVDYTKAVAANDSAKKQAAVDNLTKVYVPQFSKFISDATGLPLDTVTGLVTTHVTTTAGIVDAQGAKKWTEAYTNIRAAYKHMAMIGNPLATAIAGKFPDKFSGKADSKAVGFRVALNNLLQEHLYLASSATGAALGGRTDEFGAAGTALNANGTDIGDAIGSLYGDAAKGQFNQIWSAHNGFFVDYTKAVAANDATKKQAAVAELTQQYVPQFSKFIADASGLPQDAVSQLTSQHVNTTAAIVDAQGAKDAAGAAQKDRAAAQHMEMIGDPLASAIIKKLPDKF